MPGRHSRVRGKGQERPSGPENNSKKTQELKQSRNRVKTEEKPTIPKTNIDLSSATTTIKSLKSPLASICWIPCRAFTHWGRRVRRNLLPLLPSIWELLAATNIPGQAQPQQYYMLCHMSARVLTKLQARFREQRAVLTNIVYLHPSMSCPQLVRSS